MTHQKSYLLWGCWVPQSSCTGMAEACDWVAVNSYEVLLSYITIFRWVQPLLYLQKHLEAGSTAQSIIVPGYMISFLIPLQFTGVGNADFYGRFCSDSTHQKPMVITETSAMYNPSNPSGQSDFQIKSIWWQQVFNVQGDTTNVSAYPSLVVFTKPDDL